MSTTPEYPEMPGDHMTAGAPYGRQPFVGAEPVDPQTQVFPATGPTTGLPGPGLQGQYDPFGAAASSGLRADGTIEPYLPYAPHPYAPHPYAPVHRAPRKEPAISLVLSFFLPGLGTIVNGQGGRGIGIMLGYFLGALLSVILIGLPIMFGFWIWGMVDGYSGAKEHNARHGYY